MPKAKSSRPIHSVRTREHKPRVAVLSDTGSRSPETEHVPPSLSSQPAWMHPAELPFIEPTNFGPEQLISFLCSNGFSIPGRSIGGATPVCVGISGRNGSVTSLPWRYRVPLMFVAKFQWLSLRQVMISPTPDQEMEDCIFDIFHVGRLSTVLLEDARRVKAKTGSMGRAWRCATFDRALVRYYRRWLVSREEYVKKFWVEFGEEEFENDVLKNNWTSFVLKGHKGFRLTRDEIENGITFEQMTHGLSFHNGRMHWDPNPDMMSPEQPDLPEPSHNNDGLDTRVPPSFSINCETIKEASVLPNPTNVHDATLIDDKIRHASHPRTENDLLDLAPHHRVTLEEHQPQSELRSQTATSSETSLTKTVGVLPSLFSSSDFEVDAPPPDVEMAPPDDIPITPSSSELLPFRYRSVETNVCTASHDKGAVEGSSGVVQADGVEPNARIEEDNGLLNTQERETPSPINAPTDQTTIDEQEVTQVNGFDMQPSTLTEVMPMVGEPTPTPAGEDNSMETDANVEKPERQELTDIDMVEAADTCNSTTSTLVQDEEREAQSPLASGIFKVAAGAHVASPDIGGSDVEMTSKEKMEVSMAQPDGHSQKQISLSSIIELAGENLAPSHVQVPKPAVYPTTTPQSSDPVVSPGISSPTDFAASEHCELSLDNSFVSRTLELMFRNTLVGVAGILDTMGRQGKPETLSHLLPALGRVSGSDVQSDSSRMSELLDEIKNLKRQVQENTEWRFKRELEAKGLHLEMENLRRKIACLETQNPFAGADTLNQCLADTSGVSTSTTSSHVWDNHLPNSRNPLSHLLALNFELEPSNSELSSPPFPDPEHSAEHALSSTNTDITGRTASPGPKPLPQSTNPLPIKSQRKHHLLFPGHQQN